MRSPCREAEHGDLGALRLRLLVQAVDQFDQFAMLVVDGFDADAVALLPVQQAHVYTSQRKTKLPLSGR